MTVKLLGPFREVLPFRKEKLKGAIRDNEMEVLSETGILIENHQIKKLAPYADLLAQKEENWQIDHLSGNFVAVPGFVDAHTHICFAGTRENDYSKRLQGISYSQIAQEGGGIQETVSRTRQAREEDLQRGIEHRLQRMLSRGVTACEIKSGYGLSLESEIKMLRAIQKSQSKSPVHIVPTCLAAHSKGKEFSTNADYLRFLEETVLPRVKEEKLSDRVDIFVEEGVFTTEEAFSYLQKAKELGFSLCIHADQFTRGGAELAVQVQAVSADHLEASQDHEVNMLAQSNVTAMALPGASLGLGIPFAPCRKLLDAGASLAIASDWNPGSAPMGDLLIQAALLAAYEKLSAAETFAGITYRAAHPLRLHNKGRFAEGYDADLAIFPCKSYKEILYYQGMMSPVHVYSSGNLYTHGKKI